MSETKLIWSARELVDSKRLLDALLRRLVQKATVTAADLNTVLGVTIQRVLDVVHAQAITVFMVNPETLNFTFKHVCYSPALYAGDPEKKALYERSARQLESLTLEWGQGIAGSTISSGFPVLVLDARQDNRFFQVIDDLTGFATQSVIAVPLKNGGEVVGCIEVINKCEDGVTITPFTQEDVYLLEDVAAYTARVIHRALHPDQPFSELEMAQFVARLTHCAYLDLNHAGPLDNELLQAVGEQVIRQFRILPLARTSPQSIKAALPNPLDLQSIGDFESLTGLKIDHRVVSLPAQIDDLIHQMFVKATLDPKLQASIHKTFGGALESQPAASDELDAETAALTVKLSLTIIENAYKTGASDIHLEALEDRAVVRYRIDGLCTHAMDLPKRLHEALVSRFKVMSSLDISERRLPQDGRMSFKQFNPTMDFDLRVSTAPMHYGEKICFRIIDKSKASLSLDRLGFSAYNLERYRAVIQSPHGMILHCGPTGSGKSLTLYSALAELNRPDVNISTAEDPIEYTLPGINQMQVRSDISLTFARTLRCFLRQDPDIILVGEIRDIETAEIALESALTGHLVFSTLHTNDAVSTVSRLVEMGVPPYMVGAALVAVCAQRLLRRLCSRCKESIAPSGHELEFLQRGFYDSASIQAIATPNPSGCPKCSHSGFKGRVGIHELLCPDAAIRELIARNAPASEITRGAREAGMRTLFEDAMGKVAEGVTSFAEALGTARPDA